MKTVLDVYYILGEKNKARKSMECILEICEIIPGKKEDLIRSIALGDWRDLEDAFQYLIAKNLNADFIVTHDKKGFKNSSIKVLSAKKAIENLIPKV